METSLWNKTKQKVKCFLVIPSRWSGDVIRRTGMKNFNAVSHNLPVLQITSPDHLVVGHVVRNSALSLDWHERLSYKGRERNFSAVCSACRESLKFQIFTVWRITSNNCPKWACRTRRTRRTIIFPHSTNQIIVLWRCPCRRRFLNSVIMMS